MGPIYHEALDHGTYVHSIWEIPYELTMINQTSLKVQAPRYPQFQQFHWLVVSQCFFFCLLFILKNIYTWAQRCVHFMPALVSKHFGQTGAQQVPTIRFWVIRWQSPAFLLLASNHQPDDRRPQHTAAVCSDFSPFFELAKPCWKRCAKERQPTGDDFQSDPHAEEVQLWFKSLFSPWSPVVWSSPPACVLMMTDDHSCEYLVLMNFYHHFWGLTPSLYILCFFLSEERKRHACIDKWNQNRRQEFPPYPWASVSPSEIGEFRGSHHPSFLSWADPRFGGWYWGGHTIHHKTLRYLWFGTSFGSFDCKSKWGFP